jgi:hypothetical protein
MNRGGAYMRLGLGVSGFGWFCVLELGFFQNAWSGRDTHAVIGRSL